jgi:hypothetical protein
MVGAKLLPFGVKWIPFGAKVPQFNVELPKIKVFRIRLLKTGKYCSDFCRPVRDDMLVEKMI